MPTETVIETVLPRLRRARVERFTLTGGEPFVHSDLLDICKAIVNMGMPVTICTNATQATDDDITFLQSLGNVHVNVSFDGFRPETHGKFRGNQSSFSVTVETTRKFAEAGLLKGVLSTPNALTTVDEFAALCEFAVELGAEYVLMNPLSSFGRGVRSQRRLAANADTMRAIREVTERYGERGFDLVYIRFPNEDRPLGGCDAGKLIYVFADGATAVCPYLVFAARTPQSQYPDSDFLVGNIFEGEIAEALDAYDLAGHLRMGTNGNCASCGLYGQCGKGCPAAVISRGLSIGDLDSEQCPMVDAPSPSKLKTRIPVRLVL